MVLSVNRLRPWDLNLHVRLSTMYLTLCWTVEVLLCRVHVLISRGCVTNEIDVLR